MTSSPTPAPTQTPAARPPGPREILLAWLPAFVYMSIIWTLSSTETPPTPQLDVPLGDKILHAIEYGVLGFFLAHGCARTWRWRVRRHADARLAAVAVAIGCGWGLLDEIHQAFVPGRSADVLDFAADLFGVTVGVLAHTLLDRRSRALRNVETSS